MDWTIRMGLENREYLRDEDSYGSYGQQGRSRGPLSVIVKIIIATVAVFFLQIMTAQGGGSSLIQEWLQVSPSTVFLKGQIWRLLTYAFCHSQQQLLHIVMNMAVLYMIGQWVAPRLGDREFLWFYATSAVFAAICSIALYAVQGRDIPIIGASGSVMAVFMLFVMFYPRQRLLLMGIVPIEARWLLVLYIAFYAGPMLLSMGGMQESSNVAHSAHLGGLLFGFLYFRWHMRLSNWWDNFAGRFSATRRRTGNLRVFNPGEQPNVDISSKVDEILKKISEQGEASLTAKERNFLTQASKQMRKDR